jgi:hypothetical protein
MSHMKTYSDLRDALAPMGIEIGRDVLALWLDREHHDRRAIPDDALKNLHELVSRLLRAPPP